MRLPSEHFGFPFEHPETGVPNANSGAQGCNGPRMSRRCGALAPTAPLAAGCIATSGPTDVSRNILIRTAAALWRLCRPVSAFCGRRRDAALRHRPGLDAGPPPSRSTLALWAIGDKKRELLYTWLALASSHRRSLWWPWLPNAYLLQCTLRTAQFLFSRQKQGISSRMVRWCHVQATYPALLCTVWEAVTTVELARALGFGRRADHAHVRRTNPDDLEPARSHSACSELALLFVF